MKLCLTVATGLAALALAAGCRTAPNAENSHWNIQSLQPRITRQIFGYRRDLDGSFREQQWQAKQDINLTLRRHFLNNNPENPFGPEDPSYGAPRPPHSLAPNPLAYMHLESLAFGAMFLVAYGTFIPIPFGSVIASLTPGGPSEFAEGFTNTFSGSWRGNVERPPPVSEFRVRNRQL
jgi:hypothetical protein